MPESIWWPDDPWFERKSLPLGFITLSFRQLTTIAISFAAAYVVSLPFQFPIAGFGFGGRAAVFCLIFGVGYVISSRRVRMLPVELQVLYFIRTRGLERLGSGFQNHLNPGKNRGLSESKPPAVILEMLVEDFGHPVPVVVSDRVKDIVDDTRVLLLLDDRVRTEERVSPQNPRFRLVYVPLPQDVGKHVLTIKVAGSPEPLTSIRLSLQGKTQEMTRMKQ